MIPTHGRYLINISSLPLTPMPHLSASLIKGFEIATCVFLKSGFTNLSVYLQVDSEMSLRYAGPRSGEQPDLHQCGHLLPRPRPRNTGPQCRMGGQETARN